MIDRFVTGDAKVVKAACNAMRSGSVFKTVVERPRGGPSTQLWRGFVTQIAVFGDGFEIEVNLFR